MEKIEIYQNPSRNKENDNKGKYRNVREKREKKKNPRNKPKGKARGKAKLR